MTNERVIFMGTPEFAVPSLYALALGGYNVVAVVTQPDRPAGRGRDLRPSPTKLAAQELGLITKQPPSLRSAEVVAELAALEPDFIVVAAYGQILRQNVLSLPPKGVVGVHPSLLPRHRGAAPVAATILAGDRITGVTIFLLDPGVDSGPILAQQNVPVDDRDSTGSLTARLADVGAELLVQTLPQWLGGQIEPQSQDEAAATYAPMLKKEDSLIDWDWPADVIWRRVRAYNPWPGAITYLNGEMLHVWETWPLLAQAGELPPNDEPGTVVPLTNRQQQMLPPSTELPVFGVVTGLGVLAVLRVQRAGRRAITAAEFLRGQRDFWGRRLGGPSS